MYLVSSRRSLGHWSEASSCLYAHAVERSPTLGSCSMSSRMSNQLRLGVHDRLTLSLVCDGMDTGKSRAPWVSHVCLDQMLTFAFWPTSSPDCRSSVHFSSHMYVQTSMATLHFISASSLLSLVLTFYTPLSHSQSSPPPTPSNSHRNLHTTPTCDICITCSSHSAYMPYRRSRR